MLCTKISDKRTKKTIIRDFEDLNEGEFFISKNDRLCVKVTDTYFLDFNNLTTLYDWDFYNMGIKENLDIDQVDVTISVEIKNG